MHNATLVFLVRSHKVVLALKKRGFGADKWNGIGGKQRPDESVQDAAIRETFEEIGVRPVLGSPLGTIHYHNSSAGDWMVTVFVTSAFDGEPRETDEMRPQWFSWDALPVNDMWDGDEHWIDRVCTNTPFRAEMWFDDQEHNVRHKVVSLLPGEAQEEGVNGNGPLSADHGRRKGGT
ncbi:MAG: 8-oxo-dGTP diphosphatase [Candidatus Kerfeldbacteria bacterium]|nr:8-oxo-dGTP diphosphatase [Candidatus Kerfeldbacteria bacterium]